MKLKTIGISLIWLLLAGALFYFFNSKVHPNTADKLGNSGAEVRLERDLSGHYRAEAYINGVKTTVLVDTGATDVSISRQFADKLGIQSIAAIRTQTANGATVGYMTRLNSVKLGGIEANDVAATIVDDPGEDMLLGMSFLNRMDVRLNKGIMTIRSSAN
ncbi:MAG: retroviral-like aspartic protease family protein [Gammaproteobacteria bacterium]|nr:retroviral-like aspartic protease family protein [Gammaproteobacteria bacterium]MBU1480304.1 retroviral-like aspartic protease family protein [Gammaproteobacteria bacterium]